MRILGAVSLFRVCPAAVLVTGAFARLGVAQCIPHWIATDGVNGAVNAMTVWDSDGPGPLQPWLVVGGGFTRVGSVQTPAPVAGWDGASWHAIGAGFTGSVFTLAVYQGRLFAGGEFWSQQPPQVPPLYSHLAAWYGVDWGAVGFAGGVGGPVGALTVYHGELIAGGKGALSSHIAAWNGQTWRPLGSGTNEYVGGLATYNDELIVCGRFASAGGLPNTDGLARWNGTNWQSLGNGEYLGAAALAVWNGKLILGGNFQTAGGIAANCIAAWNGSSWSALGPGLTPGTSGSGVTCLAEYRGDLIAGGDLTHAGAIPVHNIARWDGAAWHAMDGGLEGPVIIGMPRPMARALGTYRGDLLVGGVFLWADGAYSENLARWGCGCYANCDSSAVAPVLNVNDFACFLNEYAAGDTRANCDASTVQPVLNIVDFQCFIGAFAAGCS